VSHRPELLDDVQLPSDLRSPPGIALFGDIPRPIWIAFLSIWALLFGLFIVFFTSNGPATFAVLTAAFSALMTLGLPATLATLSKPGLIQRERMIETRTGPVTPGAAATQILLIPVGALVGLAAFITLAM
jgi:hypothetical protein